MPRGKLALGQNSTQIKSSDKSNSAALFLRIQTDIFFDKCVRSFMSRTAITLKLKMRCFPDEARV